MCFQPWLVFLSNTAITINTPLPQALFDISIILVPLIYIILGPIISVDQQLFITFSFASYSFPIKMNPLFPCQFLPVLRKLLVHKYFSIVIFYSLLFCQTMRCPPQRLGPDTFLTACKIMFQN
jgi:hypothetical protein